MAGADDLVRMVPGFDFLQGMLKNAGAGLPAMGQWVAPTLDPAELDKRIQELKTVQFWLEQNSRLLATTIQALEVQRMTLSTLQTMNLPLADLAQALTIRTPPAAPPAREAPAPAPAAAADADADVDADEGDAEDDAAAQATPPPAARKRTGAAAAAPAGAVDPMQWWGALTQQFTEIAARALKDSTGDAAHASAAPAAGPGTRAPARKAAAAKPAAVARKRKP